MSKQYGLIIPGQQKTAPVKTPAASKPAIFNESSSSESDDDPKAPQLKAKGPSVSSGPSLMERRVARRQQEKALAEDPTIFQYDELYDDMDRGREEAKQTKSQEPRKPKYIGRLMQHAERRKMERELRIERQVQKDREAEGEKFKDKDTYVTAAYRKKLEAIRQLQEQDQRDEYLEAIGDVTKQKDLDGFYRHLYEQQLGTDTADKDVMKPKTAPSTEEVSYKPIKAEAPKHRSYRQRRSSEDEDSKAKSGEGPASEDQTEAKPAQAHLANNIDADSDFSIDDSSDEEEQEETEKTKDKPQSQGKNKGEKEKQQANGKASKEKEPAEAGVKDKRSKEKKANGEAHKDRDADADADADTDAGSEKDERDLPVPTVTKPPVDRTLIWRKRTVGEVFEAALARYHERKRARQG
ncbi:nuclear speckle splicing regulatory protein 1 [Drosophila serrata]|uniref:nuclear speckle splicing regulatory protein 1 n=1 Tax=Drosophila serrata TaxID=7274 RepID=UPI000A1D1C4C|nr:nuclear speckle splicing regulatory protein 1 [Drosophila serrata]